MSKVSLINVLIGWIGLVISAFAGVFIASDLSTEFINHSQMSETLEVSNYSIFSRSF